MILAIFVDADGQSYQIGSVVPPQNFPVADSADEKLTELWQEWRELEPEPDTDSLFCDWLIENKGFQSPDTEVTYATIVT